MNREQTKREEEKAFHDIFIFLSSSASSFESDRAKVVWHCFIARKKKAYAFVIYCVLGRYLASTLDLKKAEQ